MDLYTDFLISSPNGVSATLVSEVLNKSYSHDRFTRMLAQSEWDAKTYWKYIKPRIHPLESSNGIISVDDTIEKKPHSEEKELMSWHWDHIQRRSVKGINIVTFTYMNPNLETPVKLPIAFELVRKDSFQTQLVKKEGKIEEKTSRCASIFKNEMLCHRLNALVFKNFVPFRTVVFDTGYSSAENIRYIVEALQKQVVCAVQSNRMIPFDLQKPVKEPKGQTVSVDDFLYNRCAVVAEGKAYFEQVLSQPDLFPTEISFEPILRLTHEAYLQKTGRPFNYQPLFNIETYSNSKSW
jgi:hypothetical protein